MGSSTPLTTAADVWAAKRGVCRDFAHVALSFLRALNIPARYVFGYLPDMDVPPAPEPMDFAAWMEVWLGGRWCTFDPRNNARRKGRVLIGRGRDALGRGDGHHVRRAGAGADGGLGRGGAGWRHRLARPAVARRSTPSTSTAPGRSPTCCTRSSATPTTGRRTSCGSGWSGCPGSGTATCTGGPGTSRSPTRTDRHAPAAVTHRDADGNEVVAVELPVVASAVEFTLAALVERVGPAADELLPAAALADPRLLVPTRLTSPSPELWDLAESLRAAHRSDASLAEALCGRLRSEFTFTLDATTVATTAAEAYALRRGVCQDIAHVMLTVCRLAGIPCPVRLRAPARRAGRQPRLGRGAGAGRARPRGRWRSTRPTAAGPAAGTCRSRSAGTTPTSRPTSGVYTGSARGHLTWTKRVGITAA